MRFLPSNQKFLTDEEVKELLVLNQESKMEIRLTPGRSLPIDEAELEFRSDLKEFFGDK